MRSPPEERDDGAVQLCLTCREGCWIHCAQMTQAVNEFPGTVDEAVT